MAIQLWIILHALCTHLIRPLNIHPGRQLSPNSSLAIGLGWEGRDTLSLVVQMAKLIVPLRPPPRSKTMTRTFWARRLQLAKNTTKHKNEICLNMVTQFAQDGGHDCLNLYAQRDGLRENNKPSNGVNYIKNLSSRYRAK